MASTRSSNPCSSTGHCGRSQVLWRAHDGRQQPVSQYWTLWEKSGIMASTRSSNSCSSTGHCGRSQVLWRAHDGRQQPVSQYWTLWEKSGIMASTRSSNPCSSTGHYGRSQVLWRAYDPATRAPVLDTMGEVRYYGDHTIQQPVLQYWTLWEKSGIMASIRSSNPCSSTGQCGRSQVLWRAHDPATRAPVLDTVGEVRYYGEHTIQQPVLQYWTLWEKSGIKASTRSSNPCSSTGHCGRSQVLWRAHDGRQQPVLQYWTLWEKSGIMASTRSSNSCSSTGHCERSQVLRRAHDRATRAPVLDTVREVRYYGEHTIQQPVLQYWTLWEKSGIMASTWWPPATCVPVLDTVGEVRYYGEHTIQQPVLQYWTLWEMSGIMASTRWPPATCVPVLDTVGEVRYYGEHTIQQPVLQYWTLWEMSGIMASTRWPPAYRLLSPWRTGHSTPFTWSQVGSPMIHPHMS